MTQRIQTGLTHYLSVILIVVAGVAIGGTGYYLYQHTHTTPEPPHQATPAIVYLQLPGWDVSLHLEEDVRDAYVVKNASTEQVKTLTNKRLAQLADEVPACAAATTVEITRVLPGEIVDGTAVDIEGLENDESYTKKGDYYYHVVPEPKCEPADNQAKATELRRLRDQLAEHATHIMSAEDVEQGNHDGHEDDAH